MLPHQACLARTRCTWVPSPSAAVDCESQIGARLTNPILKIQKLKDQIKKVFGNLELSVSSYDTAWVAMVPSPNCAQTPCFPECLNWLLENQHINGSWPSHCHPQLLKDDLSSTLACVIALKKWNIGEDHMNRGLDYIECNNGLITDENQLSPVGFNIIFPSMIEYAKDLNLRVPLKPTIMEDLLHKRSLELKRGNENRSEGRKAYLAYVSEGLGKVQNWSETMKYQRKNGSLFNSPSTTAAALIHIHDTKCFDYLYSILKRFDSAVPTTYPMNIYNQLCLVDTLDKLGISRYFEDEIATVMEGTFRCWLQGDEEILLDPATCAMAFRHLRMRGYDVFSDWLSQYADRDSFFNSLEGHVSGMGTILELYRASQIMTLPIEVVLENLQSWTSHFLQNEVLKTGSYEEKLLKETFQEVDYALKCPYHANLQRLENRRYIEHFNFDDFQIKKSVYWINNMDKRDILDLAVEDFRICQSMHIEELEDLESWVKGRRLDQLKFARQKQTYCYFSVAATLFAPELFEARISWAKNGILTTIVDDFFDVGGLREELANLIKLVKKWDGNSALDCCSKHVEIIFFALYETVNELGAKASTWQGWNVTQHIIEVWLRLLNSMMQEADWVREKCVPTVEEYMANGYVSFALGPIILPALYFVGPKLCEETVKSPEYHNLYKLTSVCGRLLNDLHGYEREGKEGKLNSVTLRMVHEKGSAREEKILDDLRCEINRSRRELLGLVVQTEGSLVPRACKELFWNMSKILHLFYMQTDGFTSPKEMLRAVDAVINDHLNPPPYLTEMIRNFLFYFKELMENQHVMATLGKRKYIL